MGAKSTIELTREDAISRATGLKKDSLRRETEAKYVAMSDMELYKAMREAEINTDIERKTAIVWLADWDLDQQTRKIEAEFHVMDDEELENSLEELNDATYSSGSGLDNYRITPNPEPGLW